MLKIETGQDNKILHQVSADIKEINPDIRELIGQMKKTMRYGDGVGLAAPQVGQNIRLFVISEEYSSNSVFINPKIFKKSYRTDIMEEGCLSLPGEFIRVKRAKKIKVKALDKNGKEFTLRANGILARIIQHENDHLDGILISDK